MATALALEANAERLVGSSPTSDTKIKVGDGVKSVGVQLSPSTQNYQPDIKRIIDKFSDSRFYR